MNKQNQAKTKPKTNSDLSTAINKQRQELLEIHQQLRLGATKKL